MNKFQELQELQNQKKQIESKIEMLYFELGYQVLDHGNYVWSVFETENTILMCPHEKTQNGWKPCNKWYHVNRSHLDQCFKKEQNHAKIHH